MKVDFANLQKYVDYLKSIDFKDLIRMDNAGGSPTILEIPLDTSRDV